jgi:hypothetical protein
MYIRSLEHGLEVALEPADLPSGEALPLELAEAWGTAGEQAVSAPAVRRWRECHAEMVDAQGDLDKVNEDLEALEREVEEAITRGRVQLPALEDRLAAAQQQQARLAYRHEVLRKQVEQGGGKVRAEMVVRLDATRDQAGSAVDRALADAKQAVLDAVREPLRELMALRHVCGLRTRQHQATREQVVSCRDVDTLAALLSELDPEAATA